LTNEVNMMLSCHVLSQWWYCGLKAKVCIYIHAL